MAFSFQTPFTESYRVSLQEAKYISQDVQMWDKTEDWPIVCVCARAENGQYQPARPNMELIPEISMSKVRPESSYLLSVTTPSLSHLCGRVSPVRPALANFPFRHCRPPSLTEANFTF